MSVSVRAAWKARVVRRRRGASPGKDRYGNPIPGEWADSPLPDGLFAPGGTREPAEPGVAAVISSPALYWPGARVDVTASDRLVVDGAEWQVDGRPAAYPLGTHVTLKGAEKA